MGTTRNYIGTKEVVAWSETKDAAPGYAVKYADGYVSWSPKDVFERAYRVTEGKNQELSFGDALHFMQIGFRVTRRACGHGVDGTENAWFALVKDGHARWGSPTHSAPLGYSAKFTPFIVKVTNPGMSFASAESWTPKLEDMLATDWMLLE